MAMTGCFSGTVFNMLCGFGGALVRLTWIENYPGIVSFDLFRDAK
jgi:sodium/potassium/calcium exchanger 6